MMSINENGGTVPTSPFYILGIEILNINILRILIHKLLN